MKLLNEQERVQKLRFSSEQIFNVEDDSFMIIKAHLVAEKFLHEILENDLPNPKAIKKVRLTFRHLLAFVESHRPSKKEKWIWTSLEKLNSLRNEIAHNISTEKLSKKRDDFIESTVPWISPPVTSKGTLTLKFILQILCAQLANINHGSSTAGPPA
jgi:hypothetical protein